jgi:hypothetical protein
MAIILYNFEDACRYHRIISGVCSRQGVTKRCRLSWLTNSALVYEPKMPKTAPRTLFLSFAVYNLRGEGVGGCGVSANEYSCANGAQINFEHLTPYLIYGSQP